MLTLIFPLAIALILLLLAHDKSNHQGQPASTMRKVAGALALASAVFLAMTGRFLLALPFAFLGLVLIWRRTPVGAIGSPGQTTGRTSSIRTAFLEMVLDHGSGQMTGRVLAGVFAGRELATLTPSDMLVLWRECRAGDPQSRQVLEAYLDRELPEWRDRLRREEAEPKARNGGGTAQPAAAMSISEALDILGLKPGASEEDIRAAHRSLMKKLHPDQGGSTYLATKINAAKDALLAK
ncbi:MAG: DnaJ domain-containing protein [Hyphomicrobiaceae bacterium]